MSKRIDERLRITKIMLHILATRGPQRRRDIEKETMARSPTFAKTRSSLEWVIKNAYVRKVRRGVYEITEKGLDFLSAI